MRIKKSLFAVAAMALPMMGIASPAMGVTQDKLVHVETGTTIPANREMHLVGWARFTGGMKCHVTATVVATGTTGTTGHVKTFTVPDTTKCTGEGFFTFQGCNELSSHTATTTNASGVHDWDVTATTNDADVSRTAPNQMVLHLKPKGSCVFAGSEITLTFGSITLKPLRTNPNFITTGTTGNQIHETTAATGEQIAGFEISGTGTAHTPPGTVNTEASGELELTEADRCTWKFAQHI